MLITKYMTTRPHSSEDHVQNFHSHEYFKSLVILAVVKSNSVSRVILTYDDNSYVRITFFAYQSKSLAIATKQKYLSFATYVGRKIHQQWTCLRIWAFCTVKKIYTIRINFKGKNTDISESTWTEIFIDIEHNLKLINGNNHPVYVCLPVEARGTFTQILSTLTCFLIILFYLYSTKNRMYKLLNYPIMISKIWNKCQVNILIREC